MHHLIHEGHFKILKRIVFWKKIKPLSTNHMFGWDEKEVELLFFLIFYDGAIWITYHQEPLKLNILIYYWLLPNFISIVIGPII